MAAQHDPLMRKKKNSFIFFGCVARSSCTFSLLLSVGCLLLLLSVLLTTSSFIFVAACPLAVTSVSCHYFRNAQEWLLSCVEPPFQCVDSLNVILPDWTALCHCSLVSLSRKEKKRLHLSASIQ
jgi:hypothetical protein